MSIRKMQREEKRNWMPRASDLFIKTVGLMSQAIEAGDDLEGAWVTGFALKSESGKIYKVGMVLIEDLSATDENDELNRK